MGVTRGPGSVESSGEWEMGRVRVCTEEKWVWDAHRVRVWIGEVVELAREDMTG
jgi:hypothetical protein